MTLPSGTSLTVSCAMKGQAVSVDGIIKPFTHIARHGDEFRPWQIQIVMSTLPRDKLPTNISQDGSRQLCKVSSILKTQEVGRLSLYVLHAPRFLIMRSVNESHYNVGWYEA